MINVLLKEIKERMINWNIFRKNQKKETKLICSELMGHFSLGNPVEVMDSIFNTPILKGRLGEKLLLYDEIIIPTGNFGIIPVLRLWLGDKTFISLIEKKIISFLKYTGWVAYVGNGGGVQFFNMLPNEKIGETFGYTFFGNPEAALEYALQNTKSPSPSEDRKKIKKLILENTIEIELSKDVADKIRHETYMDIMNSPLLRSFLFFKNPELTEIKLNMLKGVNPDQIRVFDFHRPYENPQDDISIVLNVAEHNILLFFMSLINDSDVFSDETTEKILISKMHRLTQDDKLVQDFMRILEVNNMPDLTSIISKNALTFEDLIRIRNKSDTINFRKWLHSESAVYSEDIIKAYVAAITKPTIMDRFSLKAIRFIIPNLVGLINAIGGLAASGIDSFVLPNLVNRKSPKVFLDNLVRVICPPRRK